MPDFSSGRGPFSDGDSSPEDRLHSEAEELMRQGRYSDAVARYDDLRRFAPTDLWVRLGHASALECAGRTQEAERVMDEAVEMHRANIHLHRFRRLFFERREDHNRARLVREAMQGRLGLQEGPVDQLAELFFNQGRYHEAMSELERILGEEAMEEAAVKASVLARLGACQRQAGQLDEAREHLLASMGLDSGNHWTLAELAETERASGHIDSARRHYRDALAANPDDHWCRGHLAQLEHEQGETATAIALYEEILKADPKAIWAKVELAQVLAGGDSARSKTLCEEALSQDPTYPWAWAHLGALARHAGDLETAREKFKEALSHSPNAVWILHELADTCRQMGRYEEAHTHLEHAQNVQPFDASTFGYRADILRNQERYDEAVAHLRKAVELDPNYAWAWRELAELHALANRFEEAEAAYQEASRLEPGEAINDGLKAFILRCADRRDDAVPYLRRALELQPDYLWAWRELIEHHLAGGRWAEAAELAGQALERVGDHPHLLALRAEALRHAGDRELARTLTERALELDTQQPQLWALRAELEADHDCNRALDFAERALRLDPQIEYRVLVAQLRAAVGEWDRAELDLQPLLTHTRCPPAAWSLAADLALRRGERQAAQAQLEQGLERHPGQPRLVLSRARLRLENGDRQGLDDLHRLVTQVEGLNWREVGQLFVLGRDAIGVQRCTEKLLTNAGNDSRRLAQAWTSRAEWELGLNQPTGARDAVAQALAAQPEHAPALLLAALLAQRGGDSDDAGAHLANLTQLLADRQEPADELAICFRQMAAIQEQRGDHPAADACWDRAVSLDDNRALRTERARCRLRRGGREHAAVAAAALDALLAEEDLDDGERQSLFQDLAQARYLVGGETAAATALADHQDRLGPGNRLLLAQLHLGAGDLASAETQLAAPCADAGQERSRLLLLAQCRLGALRYLEAIDLARPLWRDRPDDEDAATILAESLALGGNLDEALTLVRHAALPQAMAAPRALLTACLLLELEDEEAALCHLARSEHLRQHPRPLVRILRAAWPAWHPEREPAERPSSEDLRTIPPFPRAVERIAAAFIRQGVGDLAAELLEMAAAAVDRRGQPASADHLYAQATATLLRLGRRRAAQRTARASGRWLLRLRCWMPW